MRLLLDTHIWLWSVLEPDRLSIAVRNALEGPHHRLLLSPVSVWECLVLAEKGRITLDRPAREWVAAVLKDAPFYEAPLTTAIALASRDLTLSHQDPADRFLVATALIGGHTLVTADERLIGCRDIEVLPNR